MSIQYIAFYSSILFSFLLVIKSYQMSLDFHLINWKYSQHLGKKCENRRKLNCNFQLDDASKMQRNERNENSFSPIALDFGSLTNWKQCKKQQVGVIKTENRMVFPSKLNWELCALSLSRTWKTREKSYLAVSSISVEDFIINWGIVSVSKYLVDFYWKNSS